MVFVFLVLEIKKPMEFAIGFSAKKKTIDRYRQIIDSLFLVFFPKENNDSANPRNELIRAQRPGLSGTLFIGCRWLMVV